MDAETIRQMIAFSTRAMAANLEGITHAEALAQPPGGGNCVNWVVGHVVAHRNLMLRALGAEAVWGDGPQARYDRGSEPVTGAEGAETLEVLRAALERSREALLAAVDAAGDEGLAAIPESAGASPMPVGRRLALLMVHEGYHVGQVSLLRRVGGRPGAIR